MEISFIGGLPIRQSHIISEQDAADYVCVARQKIFLSKQTKLSRNEHTHNTIQKALAIYIP